MEEWKGEDGRMEGKGWKGEEDGRNEWKGGRMEGGRVEGGKMEDGRGEEWKGGRMEGDVSPSGAVCI